MALRSLNIVTRIISDGEIEVRYTLPDKPNEHYVCTATGSTDALITAAIAANAARRAAAAPPEARLRTVTADV